MSLRKIPKTKTFKITLNEFLHAEYDILPLTSDRTIRVYKNENLIHTLYIHKPDFMDDIEMEKQIKIFLGEISNKLLLKEDFNKKISEFYQIKEPDIYQQWVIKHIINKEKI